ncbi:MAG TPA: phosphoenolpyruvate--protein phosphotransferase [Isosphaeraceae bacterium]|jgi:phosphotransferase system enzyme I (PtsI)|nr:phosphoenolpyruvate--protein phosphotransferase [Isosphaeraceae bacterium]
MQTLRGIAVSPGVAIGPALVLDARGRALPPRNLAAAAVPAELERLDAALGAACRDAEAAEVDARGRLGPQYADIFAAHARMIADVALRDEARARIGRDAIAAEHAVAEVLGGYAARLEGLADSHLAARAADVRDIERRILERLGGGPDAAAAAAVAPAVPSVALAHDLSPSQAAGLDPSRVLGFATEAGGRASHTAIVAAALEIPAVVGIGPFPESARRCRTVIVDGDEGLVVLDPDAATRARYRRAAAERAARFAGLARLDRLPAETRDGARVGLWGNIEFPAEVAGCRDRGAEGVGLYRTEFLYLNADRPPTEDEQVAAYAAVVRSMAGRPVVIRTLDLGADKLTAYPQGAVEVERNPFLGLRSLRLSLREPAVFRTQLRAILRVSALGDVRVMFPLVSTLGELRRARAILDEVAAGLDAEGIPRRADLPVGVMVEVPAAAIMADELSKEVDFFSIGTNDLIQYTLAVDRTNETVADLYSAADPAVLRLIAMVVAAAGRRPIGVNVCGSMGGEPLYTMLLLGLGLRQLSMPPHQLPEVKRVIRVIDLEQARAVAAEALRQDTAEGVVRVLRGALDRALAPAATATPAAEGRGASA